MSGWKSFAHFMYGDVKERRGFWYARPLGEIKGLSEEQLYWVPDPHCLCMLWHVGHIAHRERTHIGRFLQGLQGPILPRRYEVFGTEWCAVQEVRDAVDSVANVLAWGTEVRQASTDYIESLREEELYHVPATSEEGLSIAHWLFITVAHGALHLGRIQMLRAMLEGKPDRPC